MSSVLFTLLDPSFGGQQLNDTITGADPTAEIVDRVRLASSPGWLVNIADPPRTAQEMADIDTALLATLRITNPSWI